MKNKKLGAGLLALGLLVGSGAMVASQIYAQSSSASTTATSISPDIKTANDTDNIQDVGGIEKPDAIAQGDVKDTNDIDNIQDENGVEKPDAKEQDIKKDNSHENQHENETNDTDGGANEDAN